MHPNSNAANPYPGETNGLTVPGSVYHKPYHDAPEVCWSTPGLKVTRFRILTDPGFPAWDVSYCHGELDGKPVRVRLPFSQLAKSGFRYRDKDGTIKKGGWKAHVIAWGKKEGVDTFKLGIIRAASTLR